MTYKKNARGSEWAKWDLQVQPIKQEWLSDVRNLTDKVRSATVEYVKQAVTQGISVIAITDHNCGAAIDAALAYVDAENIPLTVLPGVEVDTPAGYQLLVILNPDYIHKTKQDSWDLAIQHFLNNVAGLPSPVVNADGCAEVIPTEIHQFLQRVCGENVGVPIFAHVQSEKGLFQKATPAIRQRFFTNWAEGKYHFALDHKLGRDIDATVNTLKGWGIDSRRFALVKTSDAHRASDVGLNYVWVKAEHTYEGLKQVIYDPASRVFAQATEPVRPTNVLTRLKIQVPSSAKVKVKREDGKEREERFCFAGVAGEFALSPYFNCFIGGRGSGKSTVLNFLGLHSTAPESSSKFWQRIQPSFEPTDKSLFSFEGVEIFEFIGQSEVESFATNKTAFTNAIYERASILSGDVLPKAEERLGQLLLQIQQYRSTVLEVDRLRAEQTQKAREKRTLEGSISFAQSREYLEIIESITNKSSARQRLESWKVIVAELRDSIGSVRIPDFASAEAQMVKEQAGAVEPDVARGYIDAYFSAHRNVEHAASILDEENFRELEVSERDLASEILLKEQELSQLLIAAGLSQENILQIKSAPQKIVRIEEELKILQKKIDEKVAELSAYENTVRLAETQRTEFEAAIVEAMKPLVKVLDEQATENEKRDIKNIGLVYSFDTQQAWRDIAAGLYAEFSGRYGESERSDFLKNYIVEHQAVFAGSLEGILACLVLEERTAAYVRFLRDVFSNESAFQIFRTIRDSHLNNVSKYKRIQVLYDERDIEHASFGQRCTAVIVILLLFGNFPLIIDEPEAHLDSSLIANYLVPLIRKKKPNRQLIFATHNANFVINGDAEKIFVLKNETGTTEVLQITIEDLDHREHLLNLEGGREAFRRRGERLQI